MEAKKKLHFLAKMPGGVLVLLAFMSANITAFALKEVLEASGIQKGGINNDLVYIIYGLISAGCCYFIVKHNPGSLIYVLIISNLLLVLSFSIMLDIWKSPLSSSVSQVCIPVCVAWMMAGIVSIIAAQQSAKEIYF
jgi:hypothetical protein